MDYLDITPEISEGTAVFPGDTPFSRSIEASFHRGDTYALSSMAASLHIGAHADAPCHYHPQGEGISQRPLDRYLGLCQVVEVGGLSPRERIKPHHLEGISLKAPRILFKTGSFPDPNRWASSFNSLSPELIEDIIDTRKGDLLLVGLDTPSIDPADAKDLTSHHAVYRHGLGILEGIVLEHVPQGLYGLIALPLKIKGGDASPVRAILLPNSNSNSNININSNNNTA